MSGSFAEFVDLRQVPPGRAVVCLREIADLLDPDGDKDLDIREVTNDGIKLNFDAFQKRRRFIEKKSQGKARGNATDLDSKIGTSINAFHNLMLGFSEGMEEGDKNSAYAKRVLKEAFVAGVAPIIQVPYDIQVSTVDHFIAKFSKGDPAKDIKPGTLHDVVEPLDIGPRLAHLERLNREFETELKGEESITSADVEKASQKALQSYYRVFIKILATYDEDTLEDIAMRSKLIAPILAQNEKMRELNRRSRKINDIDPETEVEEA